MPARRCNVVRPALRFALQVPEGWTVRNLSGDVVLECVAPDEAAGARGAGEDEGPPTRRARRAVIQVMVIPREGIATLLESSRPGPTGLSAVLDSRITSLQDAIRSGKALPLRRLMAMTDKQFHARRKLCYAQSRYVMFYLHKRGLLAQWYAACKGTFAKDRTGAAATEKVLGKPLEAVEREWKAWVMKLRWPCSASHSRK